MRGGCGKYRHKGDIGDIGVPDGWIREAWVERLKQMASRCEAQQPDLAQQYRAQASAFQKQERA